MTDAKTGLGYYDGADSSICESVNICPVLNRAVNGVLKTLLRDKC